MKAITAITILMFTAFAVNINHAACVELKKATEETRVLAKQHGDLLLNDAIHIPVLQALIKEYWLEQNDYTAALYTCYKFVAPPDCNAFSPLAYQNNTLVIRSKDNTALVIDTKTGNQYDLRGHSDAIIHAALADDGTIVTGSGSLDKTAKVWEKNICTATLAGHDSAVHWVMISQDKAIIITQANSFQCTIKVWHNGQCIHTVTASVKTARDSLFDFLSTNKITAPYVTEFKAKYTEYRLFDACKEVRAHATDPLGFVGNSQGAVTIALDGSLKIWKQALCLATLHVRPHYTTCMILSPNCRTVAIGVSSDRTHLFRTHASAAQNLCYDFTIQELNALRQLIKFLESQYEAIYQDEPLPPVTLRGAHAVIFNRAQPEVQQAIRSHFNFFTIKTTMSENSKQLDEKKQS